jgi:hypothetical protein
MLRREEGTVTWVVMRLVLTGKPRQFAYLK